MRKGSLSTVAPKILRTKKPTTAQMSAGARAILTRTAKASGITDLTYRDLSESAYQALSRIGSGMVFAMPRSGMSLHDSVEIPISADVHARLSAYAYSRGLTVDTVAEALISTALERESARSVPVAAHGGDEGVISLGRAPLCDGKPGTRCAQPFRWRGSVRCSCEPASGRNAG